MKRQELHNLIISDLEERRNRYLERVEELSEVIAKNPKDAGSFVVEMVEAKAKADNTIVNILTVNRHFEYQK